MPNTWKLKRTAQCAKCPWRKDANPRDIPNGYSVKKHKALSKTIAKEGQLTATHAMACHEMQDTHCVGWIVHQVGPGNNIPLRLMMRNCTNARRIRLRGEQHQRFEDTLPKDEP